VENIAAEFNRLGRAQQGERNVLKFSYKVTGNQLISLQKCTHFFIFHDRFWLTIVVNKFNVLYLL